MTKAVAISVVMPVYNTVRYLGEALDSIQAQTLAPAEIIVVDDGSTDGSGELAAARPGVTVLRKANGGISDALNHGLARATGAWLAFLDADDLWLPDKLAQQAAVLAAEEATDLVFGHVEQFHSPELPAEFRARVQCPMGTEPAYLAGAMLARRASFDRVGAFNAAWKVGNFVDWFARAKETGLRMTMRPELVLRRRIHETNTGRAQPAARPDFARILKASLDRRRAGAARP